MPVSTLNPDVQGMLDSWQTMRDVIGGSRTVKAAGTKYLPMLSKMTALDYDHYKMRADFFDATHRAAMAMLGFLFRKPPQVNTPTGDKQMKLFGDDATLTGKSLYDFCKDCSQELIDVGRLGVWVDWSEEENRPYAIIYTAQDIINWRYDRIEGRMVLGHLVLHETVVEPSDDDPYQDVIIHQWREFNLVNGFVEITVWRKRKGEQKEQQPAGNVIGNYVQASVNYLFGTGTQQSIGAGSERDYEKYQTITPVRGALPLDRILFTFFSTDGPYPEITKPPLMGMADLNLSWYRTSADLENARHYVGVPTPYACGFTQDGKPSEITLGSSRVWVTSETSAHCGFLQVAGNFSELQTGLDNKKQAMSELGVMMFDTAVATRSPEAYATVALRVSAQSSGLSAISRSLSQCLTDVITHAIWYAGVGNTPEEIAQNYNVKMNLDFMAETLQASDISTLVQAFLQGGISYETLFYNLQAGEIIEDGISMAQEVARIKSGRGSLIAQITEPPVVPAPTAPPPPKQTST
jgi:hypothetical protein